MTEHKPAPQKWQVALAKYWKGTIAVGGFLLILLNTLVGLQIWSERTLDWISTAIAGLVALGVWFKRNQERAEEITGIDIDQDDQPG
jgi:Gpi18-like mannosyltransferase